MPSLLEHDFFPTPEQYHAWLRQRLRVLDFRIAVNLSWGVRPHRMMKERENIRSILSAQPVTPAGGGE